MTDEEKKRRANAKLEELNATKNVAYVEAIADVGRKFDEDAHIAFANMNAHSKNVGHA